MMQRAWIFVSVGLALLAGRLNAEEVSNRYSVDPAAPAGPTGIKLPPGFRATVFADVDGYARHIAVRDDGTVYLALTVRMGQGSNMGVVALRDTNRDRVADVIQPFATSIPGTALQFHDGYLYFGANTAVYRFRFEGNELVPAAPPEVVVGGFQEQRLHEAKTFAIDDQNNLYVNVGAPSNACEVQFRTRGSPGQLPCPQLEGQGGIWRYDARATGQDQIRDGHLYATGVRNAMAIEWHPLQNELYFVSHGRDTLFMLFPEWFTAEQSAELPAEEMHIGVDGGNYGWPYTYWDHIQGRRVVAPEYGGDGKQQPEPGLYRDPVAAFPGHWAPNDLLFYGGRQFPERYRNGAFVVFHGSWNRAPLPQGGYKVVFLPFVNDRPGRDWEVFADGFKGAEVLESPSDAEHRPMGIAQGPAGELYLSSTISGRVWRIDYVGQ
jgi:glucose/arabinose dehydrogenase